MAIVTSDRKNKSGRWATTFRLDNVLYQTKSYQVWSSMSRRCKVGGKIQTSRPTYGGCALSDEFSDFQHFAPWYQDQIGYGIQDYEVDKDLLVPGNKVYGPLSCVLLPEGLNAFLASKIRNRGKYLQGVSVCRKTGKFCAAMRVGGDKVWLGRFSTEVAAHDAYKAAKAQEVSKWCSRLRRGEFVIDPRVLPALESWDLY